MSQRFDPYGRRIARDSAGTFTWGSTLRYGWTGREYDAETGFSFHRARYFDPASRRWTQEDPKGYWGGDNLYNYVGGSPLERRDPSGMDFLFCVDAERVYEYSYWETTAKGRRRVDVYTQWQDCTLHSDVLPSDAASDVGGGTGNSPYGPKPMQPPAVADTCDVNVSVPAGVSVNDNIRHTSFIRSNLLKLGGTGPQVLAQWFEAQVADGQPWDYKATIGEQYDRFGNFNYGATGAAAGYDLALLLRMGGWARMNDEARRDGTAPPSALRSFFGLDSYDDSSLDVIDITAGYSYARAGCEKPR